MWTISWQILPNFSMMIMWKTEWENLKCQVKLRSWAGALSTVPILQGADPNFLRVWFKFIKNISSLLQLLETRTRNFLCMRHLSCLNCLWLKFIFSEVVEFFVAIVYVFSLEHNKGGSLPIFVGGYMVYAFHLYMQGLRLVKNEVNHF